MVTPTKPIQNMFSSRKKRDSRILKRKYIVRWFKLYNKDFVGNSFQYCDNLLSVI